MIFKNNLGTINFYEDHCARVESLGWGGPEERDPSQTFRYPATMYHESDEKNLYADVGDAREMVEDTTKYPYKAVAFIEAEFIEADHHTVDNELAGTGFYCENSLFITASSAFCSQFRIFRFLQYILHSNMMLN